MPATPANVLPQSGRTSAFFYAKQSAVGVQAAATDILNNTSFDTIDNPNVEIFETLNGTLDAEDQTRDGLHDLTAKATSPLYSTQGQAFVTGGMGNDTYIAAATSFGALGGAYSPTAIYPANQQIALAAAPPATPAGLADWVGMPISITNAGTTEYTQIVGVAGAVLSISPPLVNAYPTTSTVSTLANSHVNQPNVGSMVATLPVYTLYAQYARLFERQMMDCFIDSLHIKNNGNKLELDLSFVANQKIVYEGAPTTAAPTVAAEQNDSPQILRDVVLSTYFSATDTVPLPHTQLKTFDYGLTYAVQKEMTNATGAGVVQNILGKRTQSLMFSELASNYGGTPTIHRDFVNTQKEMPAFMLCRNNKSGTVVAMYFKRAVISKYDPAGPTDAAVTFNGELKILRDVVSGITARIVVVNGTTSAY